MGNLISQLDCATLCGQRAPANLLQQCIDACKQSAGGGSNAGSAGSSGNGITNPAIGSLGQNTGVSFFQKLLPSLIGLVLTVGVIVFFFMILIGAIQWITSGGDKASVEAARGRITQALIGLIVLFSVFAIIKLVENFFGISILTLDIQPLIIK